MAGLLQEQAEKLFEAEHGPNAWVGAVPEDREARIWAKIEEMGLPLALVPEEAGGFGADPVEVLSLVRLAGSYALPAPLAEALIAGALLARAGIEAPSGALTFAAPAPGALTLAKEGEGWRLRGEAARVPYGRSAAAVVLPVSHEGGTMLVCVAPQVTAEGANVAHEPRDDLRLDAALEASQVAASPVSAEAAFALGAAVRALALAGALERAVELTLRYAGEREQFGRPLGKFQAIQHQLAVAAGHTAAATAAADAGAEAAAGLLEGGRDLAPIAAAKVRAGEAAGAVAAICHQVHGAIGFTQEHPLRLFTTRLMSWRDEFGNEARWSRELGRAALAAGRDGFWPLIAGETR